MKKYMFLLLVSLSPGVFAQNDFVRGIFLEDIVSVDFNQLHDSLHINWVQAYVDGYDTTKFTSVLQNSDSLKIMGLSRQTGSGFKSIVDKSSAQHMEFEAERGANSDWNYFATKNGSIDGASLKDSVGVNSPGYMVRSPEPGNEYNYKRTHYIASFILKRTPAGSGNPKVVLLQAVCKDDSTILGQRILYNNDFTSNNFETDTLEFNLTYNSVPSIKPPDILVGSVQSIAATCSTGVDIRVWWYGYVTTWLDKVIIEDSLGHALFSGADDTGLYNSALDYRNNYPLVKRFYLADEPPISTFKSYNYVQNKIRSAYGSDTANGKGSAITAQPGNLSRFVIDAQPHELLVDCYPITAAISIPEYAIASSEALTLGITAWTSVSDYTSQLQNAISGNYIATLSNAAAAAPDNFWMTPQLHGEYFESNGMYQKPSGEIRPRPVTANEIRMMCNLALAFGAKGIVPFPLGTHRAYWDTTEGWGDFPGLLATTVDGSGLHKNHWSNYGVFNTRTIWTGYKEKWDALAEVNARIQQLNSTLTSLSWQGAKSWTPNIATFGNQATIVSGVTTKDISGNSATPYVEVGHLKNGGTDYIFVVNRLTNPGVWNFDEETWEILPDTRDITLTLNMSTGAYEVTDKNTGNIWIVNGSNGPMTIRLNPGDGALLEVKPYTSWSNKTFSGTEVITVEPTATLSIPTNAVLTNVYRMVVNTGATLTVNSGALLKFTSATTVTDENPPKGLISVSGKINADGATFKTNSVSSNQYWDGIYVVNSNPGGSGNYIRNCAISQCKFGITIYNSVFNYFGSEICQNTFSHCLNPIRLTGNSYVDEICNNALVDNIEDGIVVVLSALLKANGNEIYKIGASHSGRDGLWIYGANNQPLVTGNLIRDESNNGIRCEYCAAPNLGGPNGSGSSISGNNNILSNGIYGVYAQSGTYPFLGDYNYSECCRVYGGYNSIYGNTSYQLYAPGSLLQAEWNWWGIDPNDGCWDFTYSTYLSLFGNFNPYTHPSLRHSSCEELLVGGGGGKNAGIVTSSVSKGTVSVEKKLLTLGNQLAISELFEEAIAVYDSLVQSYPNSLEAEAALVKTHYAMLSFNAKMVKSQKTARLKNAAQYFDLIQTRSKAERLEQISSELAAINARLQGSLQAAISKNELIVKRWPNSEYEKNALVQMVDLYLQSGDTKRANACLKDLESKYPDDAVTTLTADMVQMLSQFALAGIVSIHPSTQSSMMSKLSAITPQVKQMILVPEETVLHKCYPNPFNPTTTISYSLSAPGLVELSVFDLLGRKVSVLIHEFQSEGNKTLQFDGAAFPSGPYFVRLTAGGKAYTQRLLLLK
jgi:tetratricopeptide (TPR) repeat protein